MSDIEYEYGSATYEGDREYQEDLARFVSLKPATESGRPRNASNLAATGLAVLADGMGGHVGGARASQVACETFIDAFKDSMRRLSKSTAQQVREAMERALGASNQNMANHIHANSELQGMGSTLVAVRLDRRGMLWVSVGDSPLYLLRGDSIRQVNADHSLAPLLDGMVESGEMSREEALNHPQRNALRAAVMGGKIETFDLQDDFTKLRSGDWVVLASDGLQSLSPQHIRHVVASHQNNGAQFVADALIQEVRAMQVPYQDNTTVVVVHAFATDSQGRRSQSVPLLKGLDLKTIEDAALSAKAAGGAAVSAVGNAAANVVGKSLEAVSGELPGRERKGRSRKDEGNVETVRIRSKKGGSTPMVLAGLAALATIAGLSVWVSNQQTGGPTVKPPKAGATDPNAADGDKDLGSGKNAAAADGSGGTKAAKTNAEAKRKLEAEREAEAKADADRRRAEAEKKKRGEEARLKAELDAKKKAEQRKKEEEARKEAEAVAKAKAAAKAKDKGDILDATATSEATILSTWRAGEPRVGENASVGDKMRKALVKALIDAGYGADERGELSTAYIVKPGNGPGEPTKIITAIERVDESAKPAAGDQRWPTKEFQAFGSIESYKTRMEAKDFKPGRYRFFLFVGREVIPPPKKVVQQQSQARKNTDRGAEVTDEPWFSEGTPDNRTQTGKDATTPTASYEFKARIFEFRKRANGRVELADPRRKKFEPAEHLKNSGLGQIL